MVVPFVTCSARLPVYAIIIALIIPQDRILGVFSLQGLTLLGLYLLGFFMALISGYLLHKTLKVEGKSFFLIEMPDYKLPSLKNVFYTVVEKTKAFVWMWRIESHAGKADILHGISDVGLKRHVNVWVTFRNVQVTFREKSDRTGCYSGNITQRVRNYVLRYCCNWVTVRDGSRDANGRANKIGIGRSRIRLTIQNHKHYTIIYYSNNTS